MGIDLLKGRLGKHRFHSMLIHFPSALYPFSFVMDLLCLYTGDARFTFVSLCALSGAVGMSVIAMTYGLIDFLKIDTVSPAWKTAGLHALLNITWLMVFAVLLVYRVKHPSASGDVIYLIGFGLTTAGLFVSNYLGGELVIRHKIGVGEP